MSYRFSMDRKFTISGSCPATAIVQHLESGNYDYSEFGSIEAAWEKSERFEDWVKVSVDMGELTLDEAKAEWVENMVSYTQKEVLEAANEGFDWPIDLGFIEEVVEPEDMPQEQQADGDVPPITKACQEIGIIKPSYW